MMTDLRYNKLAVWITHFNHTTLKHASDIMNTCKQESQKQIFLHDPVSNKLLNKIYLMATIDCRCKLEFSQDLLCLVYTGKLRREKH